MAIKYTYLEDGTAYNANEINRRTEEVKSTLNAVSRDELGLGALRTEHLPSPIGVSGAVPGSKWTSSIESSGLTPAVTTSGIINELTLTLPTPVDFTDSTQSVNALMVLLNLNVCHFLNSENKLLTVSPASFLGGPFEGEHLAIEDCIQATFRIIYTHSDSPVFSTLGKSNRTISPGLTVSGLTRKVTSQYEGFYTDICAFNGDAYSTKDVAIRTVIREEDVDMSRGPLTSISVFVQLQFFPPAQGAPYGILGPDGKVVISKANLSVIPMQCRTA